MSIELATKLQTLIQELPVDRVISWVQLCKIKSTTLDQLQTTWLEAQRKILGYEKMDLLALQAALAEYKLAAETTMPDLRKGFTKYTDKIKDEMMVPEKNAAAWETFKLATSHFLQLRVAKEKAESVGEEKRMEGERFKSHVKNQYASILANYRMALSKTITDAYTMALADQGLTEDGLKQYLDITSEALGEVQRIPAVKFTYTLNSKEELGAIHPTIPVPNYQLELEAARKNMIDKFSMYWHDRANAELATAHAKEDQAKREREEAANLEQTQSVNTLLASASATQVTIGDGLKAVVRKMVIVIKDDSQDWAMKIVSAFLANWNTAIVNVSVKKLGNLSVAQMAGALDKTGIKVDGVEYKEEVK